MGAYKEGYAIAIYHSCGCRKVARFPGLNALHYLNAFPMMADYRDSLEDKPCNDCVKAGRKELPIVDALRNAYGFAGSRQWKLEEAEAIARFNGEEATHDEQTLKFLAIYGDERYCPADIRKGRVHSIRFG